MKLSFVLVLLGVLISIGCLLWFVLKPKLSADEKAFVEYVHQEAKKFNVTKENFHNFLIENREMFMVMYSIKSGSVSFNDVPRLLETIEGTY